MFLVCGSQMLVLPLEILLMSAKTAENPKFGKKLEQTQLDK